ncbi:MAG: metallophosphoesterase [Saprospiraceae bacterium]|nr:metallophosphoesterase [Saprospiraceae bacterium]
MKIAVISDIHENFHNLILALEESQKRSVDYIICLGDLMNAGVAKILSIQEVPVYMIWGNNDGEKVDILRTAFRDNSKLKVSLNVYDFLELGGRKIFISHYDDLVQPMAKSAEYDAIFYGHNHLKNKERIGNTLVVNPGEICAQKTGESTLAIYETETNDAELITIDGSITLKSVLVDDYFRENFDKLGFRSEASFRIDESITKK